MLVVVAGDRQPVLIAPRLEEPAARAGLRTAVADHDLDGDRRPARHRRRTRSRRRRATPVGRPGSRSPTGSPPTTCSGSRPHLPGAEWSLGDGASCAACGWSKDADEIELLRLAGEAADRVVDQIASGPPRRPDRGGRRGRGPRPAPGRGPRARRVRDRRLRAQLRVAPPRGLGAGDPGRRADRPRHRRGARRLRQRHDPDAVGDRRRRGQRPGPRSSATCSASSWRRRRPRPASVRPGLAAEAIDRTARDIIDGEGYGEAFFHRTGHGIGLEGHEEPYLVAGNDEPLEAGMAFSVEPGIYLHGPLRRPDRGHRRLRPGRPDHAEPRAARAARRRRLTPRAPAAPCRDRGRPVVVSSPRRWSSTDPPPTLEPMILDLPAALLAAAHDDGPVHRPIAHRR